jgi:hypothetical protein
MSSAIESPAPVAEMPAAISAKSGFQKRIDTLVREKYEADRRADAAEARIAALERKLAETEGLLTRTIAAGKRLKSRLDVLSKGAVNV